MAENPREQLFVSVQASFLSGDYADLIITCGEETFKVHKVIVCPRAEFFARAMQFPGTEAQEGKINLPEDDPRIIKLLIQYLYKADYSAEFGLYPTYKPASPLEQHLERLRSQDRTYSYEFPHFCGDPRVCHHHVCKPRGGCGNACQGFTCSVCTKIVPASEPTRPSEDAPENMIVHAKMYAIAEKYQVIGLKELALQKFKAECEEYWDHPVFVEAARFAYHSTVEQDVAMRDVVFRTICKHVQLVRKDAIQRFLDTYKLTMRVLLHLA